VGIPIYWVTSYYLKAEKAADYQKWMKSKEAKDLIAQIEKETGTRYLNTYFPILGLGEYDAEDWSVAPDWASTDKIRNSKAIDKLTEKTWGFIDATRPQKTRVMRSLRDVRIPVPPKE
jgi:hypothetical protein